MVLFNVYLSYKSYICFGSDEMRVLVIEDEEKIADLIKDRLKKEKYDVDVSLDGEDGSYNALTNIYDLIILDVMLPYKDGFEILEEIKEIIRT